MIREEQQRSWVAKLQYPGKKPCWFGTVLTRVDAPLHEVEAEVWKRWDEIFPSDTPRPGLVELKPGAIFFVPEKEAA